MSAAGPPLSTYDYNVTTVVSHSAELNVPYALCEILVAVCAVVGNGLVILVFAKERKLRRRTNYYIISLATADLLVGLFAIPFAILASIGLPTNLHACLFTVSVLVVLCTISIFCLVAVSIDRYWAILHPMGYSRTVRTKTAIVIICVCWIAGTLVGFLPLFGWNAGTHKSNVTCIFTKVMDYDYLVFLYFATIIFPALLIAAFYAHIYRVVVKQLQQIVTMNPGKRKENQTHGTMLRLLGAAQKREVKATQNLSRIVVFFIICWFPLYTINCVMAFCPGCEVSEFLLNFCIILSHLNSAGNPLLYAYHLKDFRAALKSFIHRIITGRPDVKQIPGPSGMVSIIREPRGSTMDSQRGLSMRGRMQQQLLAAGTATTMTTITAGTTDTTGAARNASLLRAVHESRMRELQQAANQTTRDVLHDIAEKSDPENIEIANLSGEGATGAMDNTNQIESAVTTTETTALTAVTDDDSTLEVRTYDFNAKLQYVDGVEDEDEDDENVDGDNRIPTSQQDSMLVIEADVNQSVSSRERLTLDEVDIHD